MAPTKSATATAEEKQLQVPGKHGHAFLQFVSKISPSYSLFQGHLHLEYNFTEGGVGKIPECTLAFLSVIK